MVEVTSKEQLHSVQLRGLQWTVRHCYEGSDFYRKRFDEAGVEPEQIRTLDDLRRLPFTTASDLRDGYPLPLLSVPIKDVARVHSSSGTTGKRKVLAYTRNDVAEWARFFARCFRTAGVGPGDRVQNANGYGLWTAGVGFQAAIEEAGAMAIPIGGGQLEIQCELLEDLQATVFTSTASMSLLLGEEIERRNLRDKIAVRTVIMGSERTSEAMRERIRELFGAEHVHDITGMTELYGPGAGIDCRQHSGIHYWADCYILEILDPATLEPVPEGETGEMVVTTLRKEGSPLVRYRTRDLNRFFPGPCACGSVMPRHDRILGRSDDMIIFKATNIYPGQIDEVLSGIPDVSSEYNVLLERRGLRDYMTVRVERRRDGDPASDARVAKEVQDKIKSRIMVTAAVEILDYEALPRSERKSKRVIDRRSSILEAERAAAEVLNG
ncbi:MAG: phenylacetate--CoA ligase [Deltaproteobacteria bacterium]|nr:phenylacetate--CoA ligase [Deltaproteobacteria bacterium]